MMQFEHKSKKIFNAHLLEALTGRYYF